MVDQAQLKHQLTITTVIDLFTGVAQMIRTNPCIAMILYESKKEKRTT